MKEIRFNYKTSALIIALLGMILTGNTQILNWEYENVLTDMEASGARPDLHVEANGNMHFSYWNPEVDQLYYARRDINTGSWTVQPVDSEKPGGYSSSIIVDNNGIVHIGYLENRVGVAYLRYATNASGSWIAQDVLSSTSLGKYGFENSFPIYRQPSVDITLNPSGQPVIAFFDGDLISRQLCTSLGYSAYSNYDLNLNVVVGEASGGWMNPVTLTVPFGPQNCLALGDRVGEFCTFVPGLVGDSLRLISASYHNHQVVMFSAHPNDLATWNMKVIDSTQRFLSAVNTGSGHQFYEGFEYFSSVATGDSVIQLLYGLSELFGNGVLANPRRRTFMYARIKPDSLGIPGYAASYTDLNAPPVPNNPLSRDGDLRNMLSLAANDTGDVFAFHYNLSENLIVLTESNDGGQNWTTDTLLNEGTNSQLRSTVFGDSVYVFSYDTNKDYLRLSTRHIDGTVWYHRPGTRNENRGAALSSQIIRNSGNDLIRIGYNETLLEQLYFSEGTFGGTWSTESIDGAGRNPEFVSLGEDTNGNPCLAYSVENPYRLRFATKSGGNWSLKNVDINAIPKDIGMKLDGDSVHICYYDLTIGGLKYARGTVSGNSWIIQIIDTTSSITGQRPDMAMGAAGDLHIAYIDVINNKLKYARRTSTGVWSIEEVTAGIAFSPAQNSIQLTTTGLPRIAFRDAANNAIALAEQGTDGLWEVGEVISDATSLMAVPLKLILDEKNRPWILYNYSAVLDELRLLRRDSLMNWNSVSVTNNSAEIANTFDFHLVEKDFYVIGKKNAFENGGIGILYASEGVTTRLEEAITEEALDLTVFPNPTHSQVTVAFNLPKTREASLIVYDMMGKRMASPLSPQSLPAHAHQYEFSTKNLPAGIYLIRLSLGDQVFTEKLIVQH